MKKKGLLLAMVCMISLFLYSCKSEDKPLSQEDTGKEATMSVSYYKDGVYEGKGTGYGRSLKVSVTIAGGEINDIQILSHNEVGKQYYEEAFKVIPDLIIEKQNAEVDVVSGATKTSDGIKQAVADALLKASGENE